MRKLALSMHELYDLELSEEAVDRTARDPDFQGGVYDVMTDAQPGVGG